MRNNLVNDKLSGGINNLFFSKPSLSTCYYLAFFQKNVCTATNPKRTQTKILEDIH